MTEETQTEPRGGDGDAGVTDGGASNGAQLGGETPLSSIMKPEGPEERLLIRSRDPSEESRSVEEAQRSRGAEDHMIHPSTFSSRNMNFRVSTAD